MRGHSNYYSNVMHEDNYSQWPSPTYGNGLRHLRKLLRGGYGYWFKKLTNLHLPSWSFPRRVDRVPWGCPSHRCKAKLKHSSSAARTDYVDDNHCSWKDTKALLSNHRDYNVCTCKDTKAPCVYQGDQPE